MCSEPITWLRKRAPGINGQAAARLGSVDGFFSGVHNANRPHEEGGSRLGYQAEIVAERVLSRKQAQPAPDFNTRLNSTRAFRLSSRTSSFPGWAVKTASVWARDIFRYWGPGPADAAGEAKSRDTLQAGLRSESRLHPVGSDKLHRRPTLAEAQARTAPISPTRWGLDL